MLRGSARDHLQIGDLRQASQNFVLDAVGKVGVVLIAGSGFQREAPQSTFRELPLLLASVRLQKAARSGQFDVREM